MVYLGTIPEDMQSKQYDYTFSYALVKPTGTWSFVKKLSDVVDLEKLVERENNVKKMNITTALQHIKDVLKPDLAILHFVCLKGVTSHRFDLFELDRSLFI